MAEYAPVYPRKNDPLFSEKIAMMEDFGIFKIPSIKKHLDAKDFKERAETLCKFEKTYYQHFVSSYVSRRSPYKSVLLYHGLGSGKTCSAVTIAETFLKKHRLYDEPIIWVISKKALMNSFEQEIFRTILLTSPEFLREQCTGNTYYEMIPDHASLSEDKLVSRISKIIRSRYVFLGYEKFANTIQEYVNEGTLVEKLSNKVFIIDEVHNIRNLETSNKQQKNMIEPVIKFITECQNNRLVFLSATPMFNEPEEILWLMSLLQLNDKEDALKTETALEPFKIPKFYNNKNERKVNTFKLIKQLSSRYISYVRGNNPFTFAVRVRPEQLNIKMLPSAPQKTLKGDPLDDNEKDWLDVIKDGIVPSYLTGIQLESLESLRDTKDATQISKLRQLNNVTYVKQLTKDTDAIVEGEIGINSVFRKKASIGSASFQYEYIDSKKAILDPSSEHLLSHSTKLSTISKLIQKASGIIVIYSNFIWAGCLPLAIMLEHMGVTRYGERAILSMDKKVKGTYNFIGTSKPSYCILSGHKEMMGTSKIDSLLAVINDPKNKNGEEIKIIIMSPIASEGLTFKNVREMHILEPWFHMNTTEQAIGRTIRHCSHSGLPIEERNVTVYLHATIVPGNTYETEDLHEYRLSAKKQFQINEVDKVIRENALDCTLMKNANYFPKDIFDFTTVLTTSHGTKLVYRHGDEKTAEMICANTTLVPNDRRAFRKESYENFIPTLQIKLMKYLQRKVLEEHSTEFEYNDLLEYIHDNKDVAHETIQQSLYPYKLWGDYALIYHNGIFIVSQFKKDVLRPTKINIEISKVNVEEEYNLEEVLIDAVENNINNVHGLVSMIYQSIDSKSWKIFAEKCVLKPNELSKKLKPIIDILDNEGSFIRKEEIQSVPASSTKRFSGYLNIFANEDTIEGYLYENGKFQEIVKKNIDFIKKNRQYVPFTNPKTTAISETIGFMQPYKPRKDQEGAFVFQFKVGFNNKKGVRKGIVCDTVGKGTLISELRNMGIPEKSLKGMTIYQMCVKLKIALHEKNRMWYPVAYKPTKLNEIII